MQRRGDRQNRMCISSLDRRPRACSNRSMRTTVRNPVGAWCWLMLAACTGGQTGYENTSRDPDASPPSDAGATGEDFLDALRRGYGSADHEQYSIDALTNNSERVAVGTLAAVREGSAPHTVVAELSVSEAIKGEPAEALYVMLYSGAVEDGVRLPDPADNRVLVFVQSDDVGDDGTLNAGTPGLLPQGQVLYALTTPQGFVVEDESGSFSTSEPNDPNFPPDSFDDLVDTVRYAAR